MTISAQVIEATTANGKPIYTLQLKYPRVIHSEVMTHRVFSRNASSTRAIPVIKTIKQVWSNPAMPVHWGKNQKGMQASVELTGAKRGIAKLLWRLSAKVACGFSCLMATLGLHKQVAGRILEPWQHIEVVLTATEFDNFFELRRHKDAQPEIQELAEKMHKAMSDAYIRDISVETLKHNAYHLPYVSRMERSMYTVQDCLKLSAARCARVSYLTHDSKSPSFKQDIDLYERLVGSEPRHASPVEHQAYASLTPKYKSNNFVGWVQQREALEKIWRSDGKAS